MSETETPAERRLRAVHDTLSGKREILLEPKLYAPAIDMGREALALLAQIVAALSSPKDSDGLCEHGEEADLCDGCDYDREKRMAVAAAAARALLARAGEE